MKLTIDKLSLDEQESKILWEKIIEKADNIPPLPEIVNKILEEINDPNSSPIDFQKIILNDPALTIKVLRMANSAFYGYSRHIDTVSQAVIILGLNTLKSIVVAASAYTALSKSNSSYGLAHGDFYAHSVATAIGAKLIAKYIGYKNNEKIFIAGLLHDIGKELLGSHIKNHIEKIIKMAETKNMSFDIAETQVIGFNHCDTGAELADQWNLPQLISDVNKYHHTPSACVSDNTDIVGIIHIADIISYSITPKFGIDGKLYKPLKGIFHKYKIDKNTRDQLIQNIRIQYKDYLNSIFGI